MIAIVLVDDHAVVRAGYRALVGSQPDLEVVAEYADAASAYAGLRETRVDVVVFDLRMPGAGALETIARLARRDAPPAILVFTMYGTPEFARRALAAGARGFVTKSSPPEVLLDALRAVARGERFLSADVAQALALASVDRANPLEDLTAREFEVLRLLLEGRTAEEVARALSLSLKTVRNLHYLVKAKLGVRDDIELVRLALAFDVLGTSGEPPLA